VVILGVNGADHVGHDAGAALAVQGRVVASVEEERLVRIKRAFCRPPLHAMREVLDLADCTMSDVDVIAYPWLPEAMGVPEDDVATMLSYWCTTVDPGATRLPELRFVPHHAAHAWAGLAFTPPELRRHACVIVLDGSGESTSGACYRVADGRLAQVWSLPQHASVGIFYEAVTKYLGFQWGEEGKTMGLAAYGSDSLAPAMAKVAPPDDRVAEAPPFTSPVPPLWQHEELREQIIVKLTSEHGELVSFSQRADVAFAAQYWLEERILQYVAEAADGIEALVLSGGVALNCTANSKIAAYCRDKGVALIIPPPASDTGIALGAAIAASPEPSAVTQCQTAALGRAYPPEVIGERLRMEGLSVLPCTPGKLAEALISKDAIGGWLEGGSEIGPRSLGNRSILARPDSALTRDRVNALKGREPWRPLAPSLTPREFARSFPGASPSPYMLIAATYNPVTPADLEGVIHVDGTARPQVVSTDGAYHDLIVATGAILGTEAVLCTSFNRAGEPLVYTPADALRTAKATQLDFLAGDGWITWLTD